MRKPPEPFWIPSRTAGLRQIEVFSSSMGRQYAVQRNSDFGPEQRTNTSLLSPYLRRRMMLESEVIATALEEHGPETTEKFVQEVIWRTYFKGWLERRPSVWAHYRTELVNQQEHFAGSKVLRDAEAGTTGIACFDAWSQELVETNYLHNHARMWFASIWIFTLRLPWALGANFFMRHLLDGDPASNTLSWRWVAGLHTRGKHYVATPWNIAKFTDQRFTPSETELAQDPNPLTETFDYGPALPTRTFTPYDPAKRSVLLITVEDCLPDTLGLPIDGLQSVASLCISAPNVAEKVAAFDTAAIADVSERIEYGGCQIIAPTNPYTLVHWACEAGADQIVTAYVPIGPTRDWLDAALPRLEAAGISLAEVQRDWDHAVWPLATAGFFKVKKQIPRLLQELSPVSPRAY